MTNIPHTLFAMSRTAEKCATQNDWGPYISHVVLEKVAGKHTLFTSSQLHHTAGTSEAVHLMKPLLSEANSQPALKHHNFLWYFQKSAENKTNGEKAGGGGRETNNKTQQTKTTHTHQTKHHTHQSKTSCKLCSNKSLLSTPILLHPSQRH